MWIEVPLKQDGKWPKGVRLPIIISVHHQSEEAAVVFGDGQVDPFDYSERQYGGRRGAWRLLEIMGKHNVLGTWIICGATVEKYPGDLQGGESGGPRDCRPHLRTRDDVQLPAGSGTAARPQDRRGVPGSTRREAQGLAHLLRQPPYHRPAAGAFRLRMGRQHLE